LPYTFEPVDSIYLNVSSSAFTYAGFLRIKLIEALLQSLLRLVLILLESRYFSILLMLLNSKYLLNINLTKSSSSFIGTNDEYIFCLLLELKNFFSLLNPVGVSPPSQ